MARKKKVKTTVYEQTEIAEHIYDMWIETDLAEDAKAGQFISVYPQNASTLLPRPISICEADRENQRLRIVYRIAGAGTAEFSGYHAGDRIDILGTLGNGFPVEKGIGRRVFLMGGGIGIPPMLQLAKELNRLSGQADCNKSDTSVIKENLQIIVGYRNRELFLSEELSQYGTVTVATEDGSVGTKGNVMDAISQNGLSADVIFACGPIPMLRAVKEYAAKNHIPAYISLEERMACGVGACLGCVCKTVKKDPHSHVNNARICTDGPVFLAEDVDI